MVIQHFLSIPLEQGRASIPFLVPGQGSPVNIPEKESLCLWQGHRLSWGRVSDPVVEVLLFKLLKIMFILNTGKMALSCWLHWRRILLRENGNFPFSPHPKATQLSLLVHIWCLPSYYSSIRAQGNKRSLMTLPTFYLKINLAGFIRPQPIASQSPKAKSLS